MCTHVSRTACAAGLTLLLAVTTLLVGLSTRAAYGQDDTVLRRQRATPSVWYEVDRNWPQRPAGMPWGQMPGVAVDRNDHVWVFTRAEPPVQVYDASGKFIRAWGHGMIGKAHHLKIDHEGMIWLTDTQNHVVLQMTPDGKLLKQLGVKGESGNDSEHFNQPTDVAVTPEGEVFVSDGYGNNRVAHWDKNGKFVKSWGKLGAGPGDFNVPHAIAIDSSGRLYVADRNNARVQVFDQTGKFLDEWRNLITPWGFCVTQIDEIWVCGSSAMPWWPQDGARGCPPKDQVFMKFAPSGKLLELWTVPKGEDGKEQPGELNWVHAMAADSQGNLYAGDIVGQRMQKFVRHN
jgi:hypothetical protein